MRGHRLFSMSAGKFLLVGFLLSGMPFGAGRAQSSVHMETEVIALTRHGFQPAVVKRPAGAFLLSLRNTTELPSLEFSILDVSGKAVAPDVTLGRSMGAGWHTVLNLSPGTYRVTIKQLPAYSMSITINN